MFWDWKINRRGEKKESETGYRAQATYVIHQLVEDVDTSCVWEDRMWFRGVHKGTWWSLREI